MGGGKELTTDKDRYFLMRIIEQSRCLHVSRLYQALGMLLN